MSVFTEGYDAGYARALEVDDRGRMAPPEYFWNYGEQKAIRSVFLAQKIDLNGWTPKHVACVEIVLGHPSIARQSPVPFDESVAYAEP